jgi:hypothetical protein
MAEQNAEVPGTVGTLRRRIEQVIDNEVSAGCAALLKGRVTDILNNWEEEALERAKAKAREMLAGLMPGNTSIAMADEVAMKVLAAAMASNETSLAGQAKKRPVPASIANAYKAIRPSLLEPRLPGRGTLEVLDDAIAAMDAGRVRGVALDWEDHETLASQLLKLAHQIDIIEPFEGK